MTRSVAPGTDAGALVDALRDAPDGRDRLAALLPEHSAVHERANASEAARIRGYVLAAFAGTGLPDDAWPYVLESLETGTDPNEVAGAAVAVRGATAPPPEVVRALGRAAEHLAGGLDATVTFESFRPAWPYARPTTGLAEVADTLAGLAGGTASRATGQAARTELRTLAGLDRLPAPLRERIRAALDAPEPDPPTGSAPAQRSCCSSAPVAGAAAGPVLLEDQDGVRTGFDEFVRGRPSVVTFFYTRCDNPYKCSATVTRLAALAARAPDVRIAGITYDPDFDRPARLRSYGEIRGLRFGPDVRFLRTVSGFDELRRRFELGVSYGASTVGRHRIELHVLNADGRIAASFTRLEWDPDEVLAQVARLTR